MINIKAELVNFPPVNIKNLEEQASELSENYRNSITLYNKAIESIKTNSEDIAVIELKKCISLNPEFFEAYNLLGLCLINMKDSKRATEVFEKVITAEANGITAARYLRMLTGVGAGAGAAIGAGMGEYRSGGPVLKKGGALSRSRSDIKERGRNKSTDDVSGSRNADRPGDVSDSRIATSALAGSLAGKTATGIATTGTVSAKAAGVDTVPDSEAGLSTESGFKSLTSENNEIKFPGKMGVIYRRGNFGSVDNNRVGNSSAVRSRNENQSRSSLSDNANMNRRQTRGNQAFNSGPEGIESIFPSFGNTKKKDKSSFFKYAAVFLAGALLLLIIKLPFGNSENKAQPTPAPAGTSSADDQQKVLRDEIEKLGNNLQGLRADLEMAKSELDYNKIINNILDVENLALKKDYQKAADMLLIIGSPNLAAEDKARLDAVYQSVMPVAANAMYNEGFKFYETRKWAEALDRFGKVQVYSPSFEKTDALYYYSGKCYQTIGDNGNAATMYKKIIDGFPQSKYYKWAKSRLVEVEKQQ